MTDVIADVVMELDRQRERGFSQKRDDAHTKGDLARAGGVYALWCYAAALESHILMYMWPWGRDYFKPKGVRRDLVRAAALIIAEIQKIDRDTETKVEEYEKHPDSFSAIIHSDLRNREHSQ